MGQEDAHDLVSGGSSLGVELFEQLRLGWLVVGSFLQPAMCS